MSNTASDLVTGWKKHFQSGDASIKWEWVERRCSYWVTNETLVVGVIDAGGTNATGKKFFGEWKTSSTWDKAHWKEIFRKNAQSLTYGLLMRHNEPECEQFTVRRAFKERKGPPTYDHAWYAYSEAELNHWADELVRVGNEIRRHREMGHRPWPTNFSDCFRYGPQYKCAFFEAGCAMCRWDNVPAEAEVKERQPWVQEEIDRACLNGAPNLVVLSATSVDTWFRCRERFRKTQEERLVMPATESLSVGTTFHEELASYYRGLIPAQAEGLGEAYIGVHNGDAGEVRR